MKLCYQLWNWEDQQSLLEKPGSAESFRYTSVILKDTSRRFLQKIHSAEKLECFEVFIEICQTRQVSVMSRSNLWEIQVHSVFELLRILNGYKENLIFSQFKDALISRTNPTTLESAKRSSLSTSLYIQCVARLTCRSTSSLLDSMIAFMNQIELSSIVETSQDYLVLMKECVSNSVPFKNLHHSVLLLATIYGEKLENCINNDNKKLQRDFRVMYFYILLIF